MMVLQQQRPWGVTAMTRSLPQAQHGSSAEFSRTDVLERNPAGADTAPQTREDAKQR